MNDARDVLICGVNGVINMDNARINGAGTTENVLQISHILRGSGSVGSQLGMPSGYEYQTYRVRVDIEVQHDTY